MKLFTYGVLALSCCLFLSGCGGETKETESKEKKSAHNHEDDHDHGDHIGGNNPHKIELKEAPFNAVWEHAGDLVTITFVDNEYKKENPIAADKITVIDAGKKNTFDLLPIKKDDKGMAASFELESEKLELTMDNKPTLSVTEGDKTYEAVVVHMH